MIIESRPWLVPVVFLLSAIREGLGVFWVHYAEESNGHRTGLVASVQAGAEIAGVGLSIQSLPCAASYVVGHYVGVQCAIWIKVRKLRSAK